MQRLRCKPPSKVLFDVGIEEGLSSQRELQMQLEKYGIPTRDTREGHKLWLKDGDKEDTIGKIMAFKVYVGRQGFPIRLLKRPP